MDFIDVKARRYKIPNTQYWGTEGDVFDRLMKPRSTSCLLWYRTEIDVFDGLIKPRSTVLPFKCVSHPYFENLKGNYRNIERMRARGIYAAAAYATRTHGGTIKRLTFGPSPSVKSVTDCAFGSPPLQLSSLGRVCEGSNQKSCRIALEHPVL